MGKRLRIAVFMCGIFLIIWPGEVGAQKKRSVNQRILEILIEKGIITENQYQDLLKQAKEEESQKEKAQEKAEKKGKTKGNRRIQKLPEQRLELLDARYHLVEHSDYQRGHLSGPVALLHLPGPPDPQKPGHTST